MALYYMNDSCVASFFVSCVIASSVLDISSRSSFVRVSHITLYVYAS